MIVWSARAPSCRPLTQWLVSINPEEGYMVLTSISSRSLSGLLPNATLEGPDEEEEEREGPARSSAGTSPALSCAAGRTPSMAELAVFAVGAARETDWMADESDMAERRGGAGGGWV